MSGRRQLTMTLVGIVAGAGLGLLAASRVWSVESRPRPAPLPAEEVALTGGSLLPGLPALALVALACAGGLVATRGRARTVVGALLAAAALGMGALVVVGLTRPGVDAGWPIVAILGAAAVGAASAIMLRHGQAWPTMGSRYGRTSPRATASASGDARPSPSTDSDTALWDALDRGDDPTR